MICFPAGLFSGAARGLQFVFESVHDAVREEIEQEQEDLRRNLRALYREFEEGEIDEETFEEREEAILDRLDELEEMLDE